MKPGRANLEGVMPLPELFDLVADLIWDGASGIQHMRADEATDIEQAQRRYGRYTTRLLRLVSKIDRDRVDAHYGPPSLAKNQAHPHDAYVYYYAYANLGAIRALHAAPPQGCLSESHRAYLLNHVDATHVRRVYHQDVPSLAVAAGSSGDSTTIDFFIEAYNLLHRLDYDPSKDATYRTFILGIYYRYRSQPTDAHLALLRRMLTTLVGKSLESTLRLLCTVAVLDDNANHLVHVLLPYVTDKTTPYLKWLLDDFVLHPQRFRRRAKRHIHLGDTWPSHIGPACTQFLLENMFTVPVQTNEDYRCIFSIFNAQNAPIFRAFFATRGNLFTEAPPDMRARFIQWATDNIPMTPAMVEALIVVCGNIALVDLDRPSQLAWVALALQQFRFDLVEPHLACTFLVPAVPRTMYLSGTGIFGRGPKVHIPQEALLRGTTVLMNSQTNFVYCPQPWQVFDMSDPNPVLVALSTQTLVRSERRNHYLNAILSHLNPTAAYDHAAVAFVHAYYDVRRMSSLCVIALCQRATDVAFNVLVAKAAQRNGSSFALHCLLPAFLQGETSTLVRLLNLVQPSDLEMNDVFLVQQKLLPMAKHHLTPDTAAISRRAKDLLDGVLGPCV